MIPEYIIIIILGAVTGILLLFCQRQAKKLRVLKKDIIEKENQLCAVREENDSLCYSISHDLRAPLRAVSGFSRLLLKKDDNKLDATSREYLEVISDSVKQINDYIEGILIFSRIGRQCLNLNRVNMELVAKEVTEKLKDQEKDRNTEVTIQKMPELIADENLMRCAFLNVVENAFKFTRARNKARIEIECRKKGETYLFSVKDNGVGFDMNYSDKVFGLFQRLHSNTDFEGAGIGLALTRRIIQKHSGQVWIESEVDKGATFYFSLPVIKQA